MDRAAGVEIAVEPTPPDDRDDARAAAAPRRRRLISPGSPRAVTAALVAAGALAVVTWYALATRSPPLAALDDVPPRVPAPVAAELAPTTPNAALPADPARSAPEAPDVAAHPPALASPAGAPDARDARDALPTAREHRAPATPANHHRRHPELLAHPATRGEPVPAAADRAPDTAIIAAPASAPSPPPAVPAPAAAPPRELTARLAGIDVNGSLPRVEIERAIARQWQVIARCTPGAPDSVVARFTIGEARRAQDVHAAGAMAGTNACIASAFTDVRTEAAPDVGDVEVTVRIAFVVNR